MLLHVAVNAAATVQRRSVSMLGSKNLHTCRQEPAAMLGSGAHELHSTMRELATKEQKQNLHMRKQKPAAMLCSSLPSSSLLTTDSKCGLT